MIRRPRSALAAAIVGLALAGVARADPDEDTSFRAVRAAEEAGRYEEVVERCAALIEQWPSGSRGETCRRRVERLERRRDLDGSFAGWAALEQVRRDHRTLEPGAARQQVEPLVASPGTGPVVRAEAAGWLAREVLAEDPERALVYLEPWLEREVPGEPALGRQLKQLAAVALARAGRAEEAARLEATVRVPVDPSAARPTPVELVQITRRRRVGAWAAGGVLIGFVGVAGARIRGGLERFAPVGLLPLALAVGGAAALMAPWDPAMARVMAPIGAGWAAVHLVSAVALRGARERPGWTAVIRGSSALATLAIGYLALWWWGGLGYLGL